MFWLGRLCGVDAISSQGLRVDRDYEMKPETLAHPPSFVTDSVRAAPFLHVSQGLFLPQDVLLPRLWFHCDWSGITLLYSSHYFVLVFTPVPFIAWEYLHLLFIFMPLVPDTWWTSADIWVNDDLSVCECFMRGFLVEHKPSFCVCDLVFVCPNL